MAKYLDDTGVQTLWNKCKDTFQLKSTWGNNVSVSLTKNQIYKIDGAVVITLSGPWGSKYLTIKNCIFRVTATSIVNGSGNVSRSASVSVEYISSGTSTTSTIWTSTSQSGSGTGYATATLTSIYTGILTKM